jgi:hypothetical protein
MYVAKRCVIMCSWTDGYVSCFCVTPYLFIHIFASSTSKTPKDEGAADENFLIVQTGSGDHTTFYLSENINLFPGDKGTNLETDYSPPLSVKFESPWRYASTPPGCLNGVTLRHIDNFVIVVLCLYRTHGIFRISFQYVTHVRSFCRHWKDSVL